MVFYTAIYGKIVHSRGAASDDFNFFVFLIFFFCFVVAICDLVHDMETIFHLSDVLTASGNLF